MTGREILPYVHTVFAVSETMRALRAALYFQTESPYNSHTHDVSIEKTTREET